MRYKVPIAILILFTALLMAGCELLPEDFELPFEVAQPGVTPTPQLISQWAATATASSQYGMPDWSARRATGAPEINACVDDARAWSSARGNGVEYLELTYTKAVYVTEVRVYMTFGRGALARITLIDEDGERHVVWEGTDVADPCPGVLVAPVLTTPYRVAKVRIDVDESRTGTWNQIDAVQLIGIK